MAKEVGRLLEIGKLRRPIKIREGTRKTQSSVLVLYGGSETRSEGPSIQFMNPRPVNTCLLVKGKGLHGPIPRDFSPPRQI